MLRRMPPVLLLLLCACATTVAQLDVPVGAWDVTGSSPRVWNQPISFGPYRTSMVNEGTRRSFLIDLGLLSAGRLDQGYRLDMGGTAVECHTRQLLLAKNEVFVDPALGRSALLVCGFDHARGRSVLTLSRTGRTAAWLEGEVRSDGGGPLTVRSMHHAKGARFRSSDTLGFEILKNGQRVGMVETMNRGRVWIDPSLKEADLVAAVSASLLLFKDPDLEFLE